MPPITAAMIRKLSTPPPLNDRSAADIPPEPAVGAVGPPLLLIESLICPIQLEPPLLLELLRLELPLRFDARGDVADWRERASRAILTTSSEMPLKASTNADRTPSDMPPGPSVERAFESRMSRRALFMTS